MTKCTNCNKDIGKIGVMSPTLNKKRRNLCITCAKKFYTYPELDEMTKRKKIENKVLTVKSHYGFVVIKKKDLLKLVSSQKKDLIQRIEGLKDVAFYAEIPKEHLKLFDYGFHQALSDVIEEIKK